MISASVVVPTRARPSYLERALASVMPSARALGAEVVVVDDDGPSERIRAITERLGARYLPHPSPRGLNAARNTAVRGTSGELVVFVDDDVEASEGWLPALLGAAEAHPEADVLTGPVIARLEGRVPRSCGREAPPLTTLDLGDSDTWAEFAWGANMAIRRTALERVGPFDETLHEGGDEQEWQERMRSTDPGGRILYVAAAALAHRREGRDARLTALSRSALVRGRAARRFDARRGRAPTIRRELLTLAGCAGHVLRRRCPAGITMVAHSAARTREAIRERIARRGGGRGEDFLSGRSGHVAGLGGSVRSGLDRVLDAAEHGSGRARRLARAAASSPPRRRVLALSIARPEHRGLALAARGELLRSRHEVELRTREPDGLGKFENLNLLLASGEVEARDWLLVVDDDVELPAGFLDRFLFLCERFRLDLAQPAHRLDSHAAWSVTRRHAVSIVRETGFVEIGPVTAFASSTFGALLPFPELRMGWGLDLHWAAIARRRGWRCGVVDAVPIRHRAAPAATSYPRAEAVEEARRFLASRPYVTARDAERTLVTHSRW